VVAAAGAFALAAVAVAAATVVPAAVAASTPAPAGAGPPGVGLEHGFRFLTQVTLLRFSHSRLCTFARLFHPAGQQGACSSGRVRKEVWGHQRWWSIAGRKS
jgi:hypothetical protein